MLTVAERERIYQTAVKQMQEAKAPSDGLWTFKKFWNGSVVDPVDMALAIGDAWNPSIHQARRG